jgi:hypothetical protein
VPAKRLNRKSTRHPSPEKIAAFLSRRLSSEERKSLLKHLADCNDCRKIVTCAVRSQQAVDDPREKSA